MALLDRLRAWWRSARGLDGRDPDGGLRYFDQILPIELREIERRRAARAELWDPQGHPGPVRIREPDPDRVPALDRLHPPADGRRFGARERFPKPAMLASSLRRGGPAPADGTGAPVDPSRPWTDRMRPQPVPCTARGLSLSGGGIRSAAVGLGALQALNARDRFGSLDYLSTVSGGGYIGACLSAALADPTPPAFWGGSGAAPMPLFPFGSDVSDDHAVAHLRNYSNYLLPRGRGAVHNLGDAAVVLLRGLLANAVVVATAVVGLALLTRICWPGERGGGFLTGLLGSALDALRPAIALAGRLLFPDAPSAVAATVTLAALLAGVLVTWSTVRSVAPRSALVAGDTRGPFLWVARTTLVALLAVAFVELQPPLIRWTYAHVLARRAEPGFDLRMGTLPALLTAFAGAVSACSSALGHFLGKTRRSGGRGVAVRRLLAKVVIVAASGILPLLIWACYLLLAAWLVGGGPGPTGRPPDAAALTPWFLGGLALSLCFAPNAYSLHRFYRDRLAAAFLFDTSGTDVSWWYRPTPPSRMRLSDLKRGIGPYHILNAALNVQGSREANRRGREADFFVFTPDFVGSDLTFFAPLEGRGVFLGLAPTLTMEAIDPALDLGTAMAISGAAVSANMGGSTVRTLSPTLALLNIRLGYWLRNPRFVADHGVVRRGLQRVAQLLTGKFYLFKEMLNLQDETSPSVYLTDGGHIENLGVYELLKRGCEAVVVIDAEADPEMAFPSLVRLERFARIDLGVRIDLPWQAIGRTDALWSENGRGERVVPQPVHCAVGRIRYADGVDGTLVYFKSSLTGDERDYVLDYRRRNPAFPHETTGDQFFSEEQFEVYRALGFHMVDGFFSGDAPFAFHADFGDARAAHAAVFASLLRSRVPASVQA